MCGGLGQGTNELGIGPRTKEKWNIQCLKLLLLPYYTYCLRHQEAKFPQTRNSFGVKCPIPRIILTSPSPCCFPTYYLCFGIFASLCLCIYLPGTFFISWSLYPCASRDLYFFTFVLSLWVSF